MPKRKAHASTAPPRHYRIGQAVRAKFKADKNPPKFCAQWPGKGSLFPGHVAAVHEDDGSYDIFYNDGFFEERVAAKHVHKAAHTVIRRWLTTGHELIGRKVLQKFDGKGIFDGTIVCWCPAGSDAGNEWTDPRLLSAPVTIQEQRSPGSARLSGGEATQ